MAVSWPAGFPVALREGYGHVKGRGTSRVRFAHGNSRVHTHSSVPPELFTFKWNLTPAQKITFETWWLDTAELGAADINGIQYHDENGLVTSGSAGTPALRFVGGYQCQYIGPNIYELSGQLERVEDNVENAATYWSGRAWQWHNGDAMTWNNGSEITHP